MSKIKTVSWNDVRAKRPVDAAVAADHVARMEAEERAYRLREIREESSFPPVGRQFAAEGRGTELAAPVRMDGAPGARVAALPCAGRCRHVHYGVRPVVGLQVAAPATIGV